MVFCLLVVPRALQRFRLPAALNCFALGIMVAAFYKPLVGDRVMDVAATLGIASLFLFAGLEVDLVEIRRQSRRLCWHLGLRVVFLDIFAWLAMRWLHVAWQPAALRAVSLCGGDDVAAFVCSAKDDRTGAECGWGGGVSSRNLILGFGGDSAPRVPPSPLPWPKVSTFYGLRHASACKIFIRKELRTKYSF